MEGREIREERGMEGKGKRGRRDGGKGIRFFPGTSFSPLPALIWEYLS